MSDKTEIERLEEAFFLSANALNRYREAHGLMPGARVRVQYRSNPPMFGVIQPYGEKWSRVDNHCVPVLLDNGHLQSWNISHCTIVGASDGNPRAAKIAKDALNEEWARSVLEKT